VKKHFSLWGGVKEVLKRRAKVRQLKSDLVFLNDAGDEVSREALRYVFKKACNKAGIDELRHTFATRLAQAGVDLYIVQS
jgi:site-specific recombinase XerD